MGKEPEVIICLSFSGEWQGRLDELKQIFDRRYQDGAKKMILEFKNQTRINATFEAFLAHAAKSFPAKDIIIVPDNLALVHNLQLTGFDKVYTIRGTRDEAYQACEAPETLGLLEVLEEEA